MKNPSDNRTFSKDDIVTLLSPTLGREKSEQVVTTAIEVLELDADALSVDEALRVLDTLGRGAGLVGITARFARQRARFSASTEPVEPPTSDRSATEPPLNADEAPISRRTRPKLPPSAAGSRSVARQDIVELLTPTLGVEKSVALVREAAHTLGLDSTALTIGQATRILEHLSTMDGIIGTAASFAKARLLLRV